MYRIIILIASLLCNSVLCAAKSYQIDLILFAHAQSPDKSKASTINAPLVPIASNAIHLKQGSSSGWYQLLSPSQSSLKDVYYQLSHKPKYQVLAHYSWRQPTSNQKSVALPSITSKGWRIQGTLRLRHGTYYLLDTDLQCSPPSNPDLAFTLRQKQRLKTKTLYYLDHPQVGMVLRISDPL